MVGLARGDCSRKGGSTLCGKAEILLRAAVAGLLNELTFGTLYPPYATSEQLVAAVNAALASGNLPAITDLASRIDFYNNGVH